MTNDASITAESAVLKHLELWIGDYETVRASWKWEPLVR